MSHVHEHTSESVSDEAWAIVSLALGHTGEPAGAACDVTQEHGDKSGTHPTQRLSANCCDSGCIFHSPSVSSSIK